MKVIVSHDVDHLTPWEHTTDLFLPKFLVRNGIELALGQISGREFWLRKKSLAHNRWHNIPELAEYDLKCGVPSTFFFGVGRGRQLVYPVSEARKWSLYIRGLGFGVGVHAIAYSNEEGIKAEYSRFSRIHPDIDFGVRLHYLKRDHRTLGRFSRAGYLFDSSLYVLEDPHLLDGIWEFPLQIMDGYMMVKRGKWQDQTLEQCKRSTLAVIDACEAKGLGYLNVLFHDIYFTDAFATWKDWYCWLIEHLKAEGHEFVDFERALGELTQGTG